MVVVGDEIVNVEAATVVVVGASAVLVIEAATEVEE